MKLLQPGAEGAGSTIQLGVTRARRPARALVNALVIVAWWFASAALAHPLDNPGFEDGLSGWTFTEGTRTSPGETVVTDDPSWTVVPYSGEGSMLVLTPDGTPKKIEAWNALGLSEATRIYLEDTFPNSTDYAYAYQDVVLNEGDTFALAWNYIATDYDPYNDGSLVLFTNLTNPSALPIIDGEVTDLRLLGVTVTGGNYVTGSYGSTGWQTATFEARAAGTYRLAFATFNQTDTAFSPFLFVDEAPGTTLKDGVPFGPIPPTDDAPPPQVVPDAVVQTGDVTNIAASGATVAGSVTYTGATPVTAHGHVWSTTPNPMTNLPTKVDHGPGGPGPFSSALLGLQPGTRYFVRAFAVNDNGTAYGEQVEFVTLALPPPPTNPEVISSDGVTTYPLRSDPVHVDPELSVEFAEDLNGVTVSIENGFTVGDQLAFTPMQGVTGSYNSTTGVLTFAGEADAASYQEILRSVTFSTSASSAPTSRTITFNLAGEALYLEHTGHFYEFVSANGITWTAAKDRAEATGFYGETGYPGGVYGLQGYLATITSQAENDFVAGKLEGNGWIGASDAGHDKEWRWVTGPEAGTHFFTQSGYVAGGANYCGNGGNRVGSSYSNWATGEPNDWSDGCVGNEDYAHMLYPSGLWNDYPNNQGSSITGYIVEYGGWDGDDSTIAQLTASKTINVVDLSPEIIYFDPIVASTGESVVITGANLEDAGSVSFGGTAAYSFTVDSPTQITAVVSSGASGSVKVITPYGESERQGFEARAAGSVYIEAEAPADSGRFTLPADHPIISDGAIEPHEYAGDISVDPGTLGDANSVADVTIASAANIVASSPFSAGPRSVNLIASEGHISLMEDGAVSAAGDVTLHALSWSNSGGPDALSSEAGRVRVYTGSPLEDTLGGVEYRERFGVKYPEDPIASGNVLYYEATLIEGRVFVDADHDGVLGVGEALLPSVTVRLVDGDITAVTDEEGRFRFIGLPSGDYQVVVESPDGYSAVAGNERGVVLPEAGVVTGVDVGYHEGSRIVGRVFRDDGAGDGGIPNDGFLNGAEAGLPGVTITAVHAGGVTTVTTGVGGVYSLHVPAGNVTLYHEVAFASGHNNGHEASLAEAGDAAQVAFEAVGGVEHRYDFGVVNGSSFGSRSEGQLTAPGSLSHHLTYRPGTEGQVSFNVTPGRFTYRLFLDGACIGVPGEVAVGDGAAVVAGSGWPRDSSGLAPCDLRLLVQASSDVPPGQFEAASVTGELSWANQNMSSGPAKVDVLSEVVGSGQLVIDKEGRNLSDGDFSTRFEGAPGDILEYRLRYANIGTAAVFDVKLQAVAHGAAEVLTDAGAAVLTCPDGIEEPLTLTGLLIEVDLGDHCDLERRPSPDGSGDPLPALLPGDAGELTYKVRID